MTWVNPDLLRQGGIEPPPRRWTWEQFESMGLAFKQAANPPGTSPGNPEFIAADMPVKVMLMSQRADVINETLT